MLMQIVSMVYYVMEILLLEIVVDIIDCGIMLIGGGVLLSGFD